MAKKKAQLEYYWKTVYNVAKNEFNIDESKLISIDNFLNYVGDESNELKTRSIEVNRDTWAAAVALSDIKSVTRNGTTDLVSSHVTSTERIGVLDTTSAMEMIDYSNTNDSEIDNNINRSIVSKINKDLNSSNMNIDDRIKLKLRSYREKTSDQSRRDLIDNILSKNPLTNSQKESFPVIWRDMLNDGIGINREELSRILEDDKYRNILDEVARNSLLDKAQEEFNDIEHKQKSDYAVYNKRKMDNLHRNTNDRYKMNGYFNDWRGGVVGKFKALKDRLLKTTDDGKLQFNENQFNDIVSQLELGTDEESKKIIKNMAHDLKNSMIKLVNSNPSRSDKESLIDEAMDKVFGTYSIGNDLKSVDKAEEALIMKAIKDKGNSFEFSDRRTEASFNSKLDSLESSEGYSELDKYLSFNGRNVVVRSGLSGDEAKEAERLKKIFEDYNSKTFNELVRIASSMDSIANSHDTASIINNYYMSSNGQIHLADTTTNES